nr:hypothetical protein BaRGS_032575 [Batillaria attramentaria]
MKNTTRLLVMMLAAACCSCVWEVEGSSSGFRVLVANLCGSDFLMGVYLMMVGSADKCGLADRHCAAVVPLLPATGWEFYSQTGICLPLPITRLQFPGKQYAFGVFIVLNFVLFF